MTASSSGGGAADAGLSQKYGAANTVTSTASIAIINQPMFPNTRVIFSSPGLDTTRIHLRMRESYLCGSFFERGFGGLADDFLQG
jgi:hypothetical protein